MAFVGVSVFAVTIPTDYGFDSASTRLALETEKLYYQLAELEPGVANDRLRASIDNLSRHYQASAQNQSRPSPYPFLIGRAMRPFGMLIFVEGIAWFLLQQYRSLIEDYKGFVRIQLKRSNYLICFRAASTTQAGTPMADVIRIMLSEDLTGRLTKDQTTEALETMKYRDEAPILESIKELKDLLRGKVLEKS